MVEAVNRRPVRPAFAPCSVSVGLVVDKVRLGEVFLRVLRPSPVNVIPLWFSIIICHLGINNRPVGDHSSET
jgi:hypothetical protein